MTCNHKDKYGSTIIIGSDPTKPPVCFLCDKEFPKWPIIEVIEGNKEMADEYDFSKGKRGVFYDRAKNGILTFEVSDEEDAERNKKSRSPLPPHRKDRD